MPDLNFTAIAAAVPPAQKHFRNLTGQRFGRWLVIAYAGRIKSKQSSWLCLCDCKTWKVVNKSNLLTNRSHSCGCLHYEMQSIAASTHRMSKSPEYRSYLAAKARCENINNNRFARYGERGIEFRFTNFQEFLTEVGKRPTLNHTISRKNNNGHYEIGNIEWATQKDQQRNRCNNHLITIGSKTATVVEWSEIATVTQVAMLARLKRGWCPVCTVFNDHYVPCVHF